MYIDYREYYKEGILEKYSYKLKEKENLEYDLRVLREEIKEYLKQYYNVAFKYIENNKIDIFDLFNIKDPTKELFYIKNEINKDENIFEYEVDYINIVKKIKKIDEFFKKKNDYITNLFDISLNKFKLHLKLANDYFSGNIGIEELIKFILNDVYKNSKMYYYVSLQGNIDDFLYVIYSNVNDGYKIFYKIIMDEAKVKYNENIDKHNMYYELSKMIWSEYNE
jgi:hypothetical protein